MVVEAVWLDGWGLQKVVGFALLILAGYIAYRNVDEVVEWLQEAQRRLLVRLSLPPEFKWVLIALLTLVGLVLTFLI